VLLNHTAGSGGDMTRGSLWHEGPVGAPGPTQLGGPNDLNGTNDWALALVALRPAGGGGGTPLVADFTATPTSGTSPLDVSFTDLSTGKAPGRSRSR
jgi:PKD repeat protein